MSVSYPIYSLLNFFCASFEYRATDRAVAVINFVYLDFVLVYCLKYFWSRVYVFFLSSQPPVAPDGC